MILSYFVSHALYTICAIKYVSSYLSYIVSHSSADIGSWAGLWNIPRRTPSALPIYKPRHGSIVLTRSVAQSQQVKVLVQNTAADADQGKTADYFCPFAYHQANHAPQHDATGHH